MAPVQFSPRIQYGAATRSSRRRNIRTIDDPTSGRKFTKSIVVALGSDTVPRGTSKHALHGKGLVVHFVDFCMDRI